MRHVRLCHLRRGWRSSPLSLGTTHCHLSHPARRLETRTAGVLLAQRMVRGRVRHPGRWSGYGAHTRSAHHWPRHRRLCGRGGCCGEGQATAKRGDRDRLSLRIVYQSLHLAMFLYTRVLRNTFDSRIYPPGQLSEIADLSAASGGRKASRS